MTRIVQPSDAAFAQGLLDALRHEDRRRILKLALESEGPLSPSVASKRLSATLSSTSKHFKVLVDAGLIVLTKEVPNRGAVEHFYIPDEDTMNHPIVRAVLRCM